MTEITADTLVKPDMRAVLSRTHLSKNINGFLLPILEAVSNGIHGIESRFGDEASQKGKIQISIQHFNDPAKLDVTILDNGTGLDDANYLSFKTPFSGYKLKQNGRGFGRFIAFKVFSKITYASQYTFFDDEKIRHFRFDIQLDSELAFINEPPKISDCGVKVNLQAPLTDWHELIREFEPDAVADEIGSHFLPQFLYGWLPEITISFDGKEPESITSHFKDIFVEAESGEFECDIDGELSKLKFSIAKVPKTRSFKNHCLLFSAADRIVGRPRDLTNKLGQPHFLNSANEKYIVIAVVKSDAFESRLNDARTGINISSKTIEGIVSAVSDVISGGEKEQIEKIKSKQSVGLGDALRENPILKLGLKGRSIGDYVASKPNNWKPEEFISDLAIERHRATSDLTKAIVKAASDADDYEKTIKDIVNKIDENKKQALAEYVIHRKNIIELGSGLIKLTP